MAPYCVALVVDPGFGEEVLPLAIRVHVWVCESSVNKAAVWKAWANMTAAGAWDDCAWNDRGVTLFWVPEDASPEGMAVGILESIDQHHGEASHVPPWSRLEVYGVGPTRALREALQEYGVRDFVETPTGFFCSRELA